MKVSIVKRYGRGQETFHNILVSVKLIAEKIRTGENSKDDYKLRDLVTQIRNETNPELRRNLKENLPSIVFCLAVTDLPVKITEISYGKYKLSGLYCADFDHLTEEYYNKVVELLKDNALMLFRSPSGDGLKVVIKYSLINKPTKVVNPSEIISQVCDAFTDWCDENNLPKPDKTSKNANRKCYYSFDPDIIYNENFKHFDINFTEPEEIERTEFTDDVDDDATLQWLTNFENYNPVNYVKGQQYHYIVSLAGACNIYGVNKNSVISFCKTLAIPKDYKNIEKYIAGIYKSYIHQYHTKHFNKNKTNDI
jgi:hypothetical protein